MYIYLIKYFGDMLSFNYSKHASVLGGVEIFGSGKINFKDRMLLVCSVKDL